MAVTEGEAEDETEAEEGEGDEETVETDGEDADGEEEDEYHVEDTEDVYQDDETAGVLHLDLDGLFLDLLGLEVNLNPVTLDVSARPGGNNLLGNLLSAVTGLLDGPGAVLDKVQSLLGKPKELLGSLVSKPKKLLSNVLGKPREWLSSALGKPRECSVDSLAVALASRRKLTNRTPRKRNQQQPTTRRRNRARATRRRAASPGRPAGSEGSCPGSFPASRPRRSWR